MRQIEATRVTITKLDTSRFATFKRSDNTTYTVEYRYRVKIEFSGSTREANVSDMRDAYEFIEANRFDREYTWEEITDNGRYSCD